MEIYINNYAALSSLGFFSATESLNWDKIPNFEFYKEDSGRKSIVAKLADDLIKKSEKYIPEQYLRADRIVKYANYLALATVSANEEFKSNKNLGVFIGSSRAATGIFEELHSRYIKGERLPAATSPLTTHANVASAVAASLDLNSVAIEHSVTCSSGLFSLLDAQAWIKSGTLERAIAGGVEASLTDFTLAQMQSLKIYSNEKSYPYSLPFAKNQEKNTFVLGEGGALFMLSNKAVPASPNYKILGFGLGYENSNSLVGISKSGDSLRLAMQKAIKERNIQPDLIIAHAPGTVSGDNAEASAIRELFPKKTPYIFSSKFLFGHTLGASGTLSLALACDILNKQRVPEFPYETIWGEQDRPEKINTILVNATGFGGTSVCLVIEKV